MASNEIKVKNTNIKQIFNSMEYGNVLENVDSAKEWLEKQKGIFLASIGDHEHPTGKPTEIKYNEKVIATIYTPESITIDKILTKAASSKNNIWVNMSGIQKTNLLTKLAEEITKNVKLFCEIEVCIRGILSRDTRKNLSLCADYLKYYASYAVKLQQENPTWKPEGLAVCVISDDNPLVVLGMVLGPCLAAGYNIILQTGLQYAVSATLFIELANKIGMPDGIITLIPGNEINLQNFFTHDCVSVVTIFGSLYNENYNVCNSKLVKLMTFSRSKIPMIVFNDADFDSACDSVVSSVWSYNGLLPWSVDTILIQEDVHTEFINKLKIKVNKVNVGLSNNKLADISQPINSDVIKDFTSIIQKAALQGIEVYSDETLNSDFKPTLLIGQKVNPNNVIKDKINVPLVNILSFRTINEAITLANNSKQGFGASVWTDSLSIANEVTKKLKVGNVWINSNGIITPELTISPYKESSNFYLGGSDGFYEYINIPCLKKNLNSSLNQKLNNGNKFVSAVNAAKKAQIAWNKLSNKLRAENLIKFAVNIDKIKKQLSIDNQSVLEKWLDDWIITIFNCCTQINNCFCGIQGTYNFNTYREPLGVISIESDENTNKNLIISALLMGNAVIILNTFKTTDSIYNEFIKIIIASGIPAGVFNVISDVSVDIVKTAIVHKELDLYIGNCFNNCFSSVSIKDSKKFTYVVNNNWNEILKVVSKVKNVWSDGGQSFM